MIRSVVPFKRWHYDWLAGSAGMPIAEHILASLESSNSWTGVVDGEPLVCAGAILQWPGRHMAWAYLAPSTGPHMFWITREVLKRLVRITGRIELTVRQDFPAGQKWAELLGFRVETPLFSKYGPQGEDHVGYVRLN